MRHYLAWPLSVRSRVHDVIADRCERQTQAIERKQYYRFHHPFFKCSEPGGAVSAVGELPELLTARTLMQETLGGVALQTAMRISAEPVFAGARTACLEKRLPELPTKLAAPGP